MAMDIRILLPAIFADTLNQISISGFGEGFMNAGNDNYTSMGSIMFNEVASMNSITSAIR